MWCNEKSFLTTTYAWSMHCRRVSGTKEFPAGLGLRMQGDANDGIAAVFSMPSARPIAHAHSGMSAMSAGTTSFTER